MHHLVFGINFQIHSVSLTILVLIIIIIIIIIKQENNEWRIVKD